MAQSTYNYFSKKYDFFKTSKGSVVSGFVGVKKPNCKIFEILLNKYNLIPNECLLIDDDDTNRTFEAANKLGIFGRSVKSNSIEDIEILLIEFEIGDYNEKN